MFFSDVIEHHHGAHGDCKRVGDSFSCDIWRTSVDSFEDCTVLAKIRARNNAQSTDKPCAQIADDIAVEIFHKQYIKARRVLDQSHTRCVDDKFFIFDRWEFTFMHFSSALDKHSVGQLHNVCFVKNRDFLTIAVDCISECEFCNS